MSRSLEGIVVGVPERRFAREFGALLERHGARIDLVPLIEEVLPENRSDLHEFIRRVVALEANFVVFTTGVGVRFVVGEAEALGLRHEFLEALRRLRIVARGSKTVAALNREQVPIEHIAEDGTSAGIIEWFKRENSPPKLGGAAEPEGRAGVVPSRGTTPTARAETPSQSAPPDSGGESLLLQLYGSPNPSLVRGLEACRHQVFAAQAYMYREVSDAAAIEAFIHRILSRQINVLAITSAPQVRILFDHAEWIGQASSLTAVLNAQVIVAAVGTVALDALAVHGVTARIVPDSPKLGPFATAIADFFSVVPQ